MNGEIVWDDAGREPVRVEVHSCGDHLHLTAQCPLSPELGYHIVLSAAQAVTLAQTIADGIEQGPTSRDANEYDTSDLWIA
jgi:hypothetical protein